MEVHLLDPASFSGIHVEQALDIRRHSLIDQVEEAARGRVKAIVEVENPVPNMGEAWVHGGRGPSRFVILSKLKGFDNHMGLGSRAFSTA
jgi:hypothetical protein